MATPQELDDLLSDIMGRRPRADLEDTEAPTPRRRKGGPRTAEGLAVASGNSITHGITAARPVVPGEDPDEWEAHRAAVVDDLAPVGKVETLLAERAALLFWRLGRVWRAEVGAVARQMARGQTLYALEEIPSELGQAARLVPYDQGMSGEAHLTRYEVTISRLLFQVLHELEARQKQRRGEAAPLGRLDVNGQG